MIYCNICGTTHGCTVCPKCGGVAAPQNVAPPEIRSTDLLAAVAEHYKDRIRDAPGHSHRVEGRWDFDGAECEWCKTWQQIRSHLAANGALSGGRQAHE